MADVEEHIQAKGHLHNTPSAEAIQANGGIELGEMTVNQQEKIEELFLHLIEMNKQVQNLQAQLDELQSK